MHFIGKTQTKQDGTKPIVGLLSFRRKHGTSGHGLVGMVLMG